MGLVIGKWMFAEFTPRSVQEVSDVFSKQTDLGTIICDRFGEDTLFVKSIGEHLFDWNFDVQSVSVHSFLPAHPYLWENLDLSMRELGGMVASENVNWKPNPQTAKLRVKWTTLTDRQRLLLTVPTVFAVRPLDRFL